LKRAAILILAVLAAFTFAEGKSTRFLFTWLNPNYTGTHFKNIMVIGINGKAGNRAAFEDAVTAALTRPGVTVIPSYSLLPRPSATPIDMNQLRDVVQGQNIDAIIVTRLIKVTQKVTDIPGYVYQPFPYYNTFYGYYATVYPLVYAPDYLQVDRTAQIETNFYSTTAPDGTLIWSGTSDTINPKNATKLIDDLAKLIALKLQEANVL
jgi:hypothetical protein